MTDPVALLRELLAMATPGDWHVSGGRGSVRAGSMRVAYGHDGNAVQRDADYALIVAAKNHLPGLLDRLDAAEKARDEAERELQSALAVKLPDWAAWTKDLRKAAVRDSEPLDDEKMNVFRHAVADNHCKSTASERYECQYRVETFAKRYGRQIVARLDASEARATALEAALRAIQIEAERPNGAWVHLKRVIGINAKAALQEGSG